MSLPSHPAAPGDQPTILLLDACTVINLYACGHMSEILRSLAAPVGIVDRVQHESLYIRRGGTGDDARERDTIDLTEMLSHGQLHVVPPATDDELNTFIDLTLELGDGEAMTVAVALQRGHTVVTDDRVALRVIDGRIPTLTSLELIKGWVEQQHIAHATITAALLALRQRGSYLPGRTHALRTWWDQYMEHE